MSRRALGDYELAALRRAETRCEEANYRKPVKQLPIYRGDKRQHIVTRVMDRLRDWRSSPFEFEGACIQGLRSGLCMKGYPWHRSNAEAESVVAEALRLLGAKRPSWTEGQPEYTESRENCTWCMKPIEDDRLFGSQRHCSPECARAASLALEQRDTKGSAYRAALRLITAANAPPKPCEYCGKLFQSDREEARFCSPGCVVKWQHGDNLKVDITCEVCGKVTKPRKKHSTACSHSCAGIIRRRRELIELENQRRVCPHCGDEFQPTGRKQLICGSARCQRVAKRKQYHATKTVTPHHLRCEWCQQVFVSKFPNAQFCCKEHGRIPYMLKQPTRTPRTISPPVFDYVFRKAA